MFGRKKDPVEALAKDIDDAMYDFDIYRYQDAVFEGGETIEQSRARHRGWVAEMLRSKDGSVLDTLCDSRDACMESKNKSLAKRFKDLISRTEKLFNH